MTTTRRRKPWGLLLIQLLVGLLLPLCFFAMVSTFAAVPREKALLEAKHPIPEEWTWVVPNHGGCYPWPLHGPIAALFLLGLIGGVVFLAVTARGWDKPTQES